MILAGLDPDPLCRNGVEFGESSCMATAACVINVSAILELPSFFSVYKLS